MNVEAWETVSLGDGPATRIRALQYLLRARGQMVAVDGSFGPATDAAVRVVQAARGVPVTGVVDPTSWRAIVVPTGLGSSGDAVRAVQVFGLAKGPGTDDLVVDGSFGALTQDAVRYFQGSWGLTVDGSARQETWSFLTADPRTAWPLGKVGSAPGDERTRAIQHLLGAHGFAVAVDGSYGPVTGEAVRQFQLTQRATFISTTTGQLDWPALIATVSLGDTGSVVRAVQSQLGLVEDGSFGPATDARVRDFQGMFAPPVDGIVGPQTWHAFMVPKFE